jgi:Flp pilus assembly protein TadG
MNLIARSRLTTASLLARFRANVGGNVAIVFAFSVITITVALGGAVDVARAYSARQKLVEVATLACQYASRPSVIQTDATDYSGQNGQAAYTTAVTNFITSSLKAQNFQYAQTTGTPFSSTQNGPANVNLTASVPTTIMQIAQIMQVPVSASVHCYDSAGSVAQVVNSPDLIVENFDQPTPPCNGVCYINSTGTLGAPATPTTSFPAAPAFTGTNGNGWYVTGYCLEIDATGSTEATTPNATHSAELDCDNGSGTAGNSAITTKVYLESGNYEMRYYYAARVDYADYNPAYICGSTAFDVSWANDTNASGGPQAVALRNNQLEVYLDQATGASPPMHTTMFSGQQLAGSNLIDVCVYGKAWIQRSVRIFVSTPAFYWLTFAADGMNNSYGGDLDDIILCPGTCAGAVADNFPSSWLAANNGGVNKVLFEDTFASPGYSYGGSDYTTNGNMYYSNGTSGSASSGWPNLAASGWALAGGSANALPYWDVSCPSGTQCIELGWNGNSLISRPFLLDPGYYQVSYSYVSEISFAALTSAYCGATPAASGIASLSPQSAQGTIRAIGSTTSQSPYFDTNAVGVFMSHSQLASTPNPNSTLNSTSTTYTNPDGSVTTNPAIAPNGISLTSYNPSQVNPLLDMCAYAATPQARTANILIQKPGYYWLTFAALGGSDVFGGWLDDIKLTALGSPYMSSPPASAIAIPTPTPSTSGVVSFSGFEIIADPLTAPAAEQ